MDSDGESSKSPIPKIDQSERMCVSCGCPIRDRYVMKVTPDLHWHITCLACAECGKQLDEKITCFVKGGKTYCKEDYFRTRGIICRKCTEPFNESDFVMRVDQVIYHAHCFTCSMCQVRLRTGDQFYLDERGNLFCIRDYEIKADGFLSKTSNLSNNNNNNSYNNMAAASEDEEDADDDYPLLSNKTQQQHWNGCSSNSRESFCCSEGSFAVPLVQGESCKSLSYNRWSREQPCQSYSVEQLPQRHHATTGCDVDFYNCNNNISPHAATTTPTTANCQISPSISSPTCNDYEAFAAPTAGDYKDFSRNCSNYYKSYTTNQNNYYKNQSNSLYSDNNTAINNSNNNNNNNSTSNNNRTTKPKSDGLKSKAGSKNACDAQPHKTTRIRTVLNEKQLHMLKTCYAANPRPDALMKDQLVEMTGLNSRVIRVWFQNKRCKDKKRSIQLKQVRQCNQDKMKNMGMITIASPTIQSEHSPNIGTSSLDSDKFIGPPSMTHSNGDWADYSSYGMNRRTYHSNNPVSSGLTDDPLYRLEGLNCSTGLGGQYQVPDQSQLIPRHQTPPIQQLLNSFGSNRVGPSERKHPYTEFSAKAKLPGKPGTRNEDCPGNPDHVVDSGNNNNHNNNNNNTSKGYSFDSIIDS